MTPEQFKRYFYSDTHREYISKQPCAVCYARGFNDPHHIKTRRAGGTWRDLVPLCHTHHVEFHNMGVGSFERRYAVDLHAVARRLAAKAHDDPQF